MRLSCSICSPHPVHRTARTAENERTTKHATKLLYPTGFICSKTALITAANQTRFNVFLFALFRSILSFLDYDDCERRSDELFLCRFLYCCDWDVQEAFGRIVKLIKLKVRYSYSCSDVPYDSLTPPCFYLKKTRKRIRNGSSTNRSPPTVFCKHR